MLNTICLDTSVKALWSVFSKDRHCNTLHHTYAYVGIDFIQFATHSAVPAFSLQLRKSRNLTAELATLEHFVSAPLTPYKKNKNKKINLLKSPRCFGVCLCVCLCVCVCVCACPSISTMKPKTWFSQNSVWTCCQWGTPQCRNITFPETTNSRKAKAQASKVGVTVPTLSLGEKVKQKLVAVNRVFLTSDFLVNNN